MCAESEHISTRMFTSDDEMVVHSKVEPVRGPGSGSGQQGNDVVEYVDVERACTRVGTVMLNLTLFVFPFAH
jgi:hypothetical protein